MRTAQPSQSQAVIFTDLDGTFLDCETYSYEDALPAVGLIKEQGIPLVFCSSKTRKEQEVYRRELAVRDPFIVEDGGAVFIPKDYFTFSYPHDRTDGNYRIIELGSSYGVIRRGLQDAVRETGLELRGYGDMTVKQVMEKTGLDEAAARRALRREYAETLVTSLTPVEFERLDHALHKRGLSITKGGRWYGISRSHDKGRAASILIKLFRQQYGTVWTVGLGDSPNDVPLLAAVDVPVLVQKPRNLWESVDIPGLHRAQGVGPAGWNRAILTLFSPSQP